MEATFMKEDALPTLIKYKEKIIVQYPRYDEVITLMFPEILGKDENEFSTQWAMFQEKNKRYFIYPEFE